MTDATLTGGPCDGTTIDARGALRISIPRTPGEYVAEFRDGTFHYVWQPPVDRTGQ